MCPDGFVKSGATKDLFNFECVKCDSDNSLAPNRDQTACYKCEDPNMEPIQNGECVCKEGFRTIEVDSRQFPLRSIPTST